MWVLIKRQPPGRLIAAGFISLIFLGSALLILPCSVREGVSLSYIDALYTSTSAVCVTGLTTIDAYDTFTLFGQIVLCLLIQIGGLGVTSVGAGVIVVMGKRMGLKGRTLIVEASNLDSAKGVMRFVKDVFVTTIIIEAAGAMASIAIFAVELPLGRAVWTGLFHSIASFNNAGFDILGGGNSLILYNANVALNIVTCLLVILGGIGFLVIRELLEKRFCWKRLSLHARVVLITSLLLTIGGAVLFLITDAQMGVMGSLFLSVSARTAGFATYRTSNLSNAGLIVLMLLMVIGASPGSTGGGIKTTTFFALLSGVKASATNTQAKAFHYSLPRMAFRKACVIVLLAVSVIFTGTVVMCLLEPGIPLRDALFEITSAFGTAGLSTGITPTLGVGAKLLTIVVMYIGRLGPLTVATLWYFSDGDRVRYPDGELSIG